MACTTFMPTQPHLLAESMIQRYIADHSNETDAPTLHPDVAYDPIAAKTSHERWALLYKTACIVTLVAFTALFAFAIWSSGATATFEAATVFVLLLLLFLPAVSAFALDLWTGGLNESDQAAMDQKLIEKMELLTEDVIADRLKTWGITSQIEPPQLASVLAQYDLLVESSEKQRKQMESAFSAENVQRHLTEEEYTALVGSREVSPHENLESLFKSWTIEKTNFKNLNESRIHAVKTELTKHEANTRMLAAWDRFRAARLLKLMENPYLTNTDLSRFYCVTPPLSGGTRTLLAQRFEDPSTNIFLRAQLDPPTPYSAGDLLDRSPLELAQQIFNLNKVK